jgi:hypothetical protein
MEAGSSRITSAAYIRNDVLLDSCHWSLTAEGRDPSMDAGAVCVGQQPDQEQTLAIRTWLPESARRAQCLCGGTLRWRVGIGPVFARGLFKRNADRLGSSASPVNFEMLSTKASALTRPERL